QLIQALLAEASSAQASSAFIHRWREALSRAASGSEIIEWLDVLTAIRARLDVLFPAASARERAHGLLEDAYALTGEMAHRRQLYQHLESVEQSNRLNRIVQTMSITYDTETLMQLLAQELPGLGIRSCFVALYDEPGQPPAWSRLILGFVDKRRLPLE